MTLRVTKNGMDMARAFLQESADMSDGASNEPDSPNKHAAREFLTLVCSGRIEEAYDLHVAAGFRHHNPWFRGDRQSLLDAMAANARENPAKHLVVKLAIEEGDKVVVFSHMKPDPSHRGFALVHIFRFENGRIAELWDTGQAVPDESPNENGMF